MGWMVVIFVAFLLCLNTSLDLYIDLLLECSKDSLQSCLGLIFESFDKLTSWPFDTI
jgi:hypothetical protein